MSLRHLYKDLIELKVYPDLEWIGRFTLVSKKYGKNVSTYIKSNGWSSIVKIIDVNNHYVYSNSMYVTMRLSTPVWKSLNIFINNCILKIESYEVMIEPRSNSIVIRDDTEYLTVPCKKPFTSHRPLRTIGYNILKRCVRIYDIHHLKNIIEGILDDKYK